MFSRKQIYNRLFIITFFISIVTPIFPTYTSGMMYHVLFISLLPVIFLPFVFKVRYEFLLPFLFCMLCFSVFSVLAMINEGDISISSIMSSFKIYYFCLYIVMGYVFAYTDANPLQMFKKAYLTLVSCALIVGCIEIVFPSLSYFLYKRESMEILSDKMSSIFNTTYHFAFFIFFAFIYYLVSFTFTFTKPFEKTKVKYPLVKLLVIFTFILFTQSRMFVMVSIIISVILLLPVLLKNINNIKVILCTIVAAIIFAIFCWYFGEQLSERFYYVIYGIDYLFSGNLDFSGSGSGSFNTRINQIIYSIQQLSDNPLIGAGSGKDIYLESLYAYLIYKYALPGLCMFFICLIFLLRKIKVIIKMRPHHEDIFFLKTCYWFFLLSPFYFLSGPLFDVPKLSAFYFVLIGLVYGFYYKTDVMNEKRL